MVSDGKRPYAVDKLYQNNNSQHINSPLNVSDDAIRTANTNGNIALTTSNSSESMRLMLLIISPSRMASIPDQWLERHIT